MTLTDLHAARSSARVSNRISARPLRTLGIAAAAGLLLAGCGGAAGTDGSSSGAAAGSASKTSAKTTATTKPATGASSSATDTRRAKAVKFSECMRAEGVDAFPDPDASGDLTIDAVVNGSGIDTDGAAWPQALAACHELQPAGFTGQGRTPEQQKWAVRFAQCVRDEGIKDFPDPLPDGALIDTTRIPSAAGRGALEIPGLQPALDTCGQQFAAKAGVSGP